MRVLVFGGSFDPPHRGHLELLRAAAARVDPDRIVVLPAWRAPLKGAPGASAADRAAMARSGLLEALPPKWRARARLDLSEIRARRRVYTYESLRRFEGDDVHFLVGGDSAASFSKWRRVPELRRAATWWCGARAGEGRAIPSFFERVPGRFRDVSSTELRSALALGEDCAKDLLPAVLGRVRSRGLYGLDRLARLKATLRPGRFEHTLNVAALAESLARRWGADPDKARTAGLLHDAGRRFPPILLAAYVRRRRLKAPERERLLRLDPMLLHAYASEDLARREFGVTDAAVLGAIRRHTLGDERLSLLDTVLYVADACSADRSHPGVEKTRALAFVDLDEALKRCVAEKLTHALERGAWLHPLTVRLWNSLASL